ncbi:MAG: PQQ-binding-like beta-propeller repeat protein [Phycisphaerales bacterium]|nr:PQQ-binding-like beta-propeller repeat protein [Phycisphaerales bacterium]
MISRYSCCVWVAFCLCLSAEPLVGAQGDVLKNAGVQGGLIVHVGCGDGAGTLALRPDDRYTVHGLASDASDISKARTLIAARGLYGEVSVRQWTPGKLPYADGLVDMLLIDRDFPNASADILRVLTPGGTVVCKESLAKMLPSSKSIGSGYVKYVKPWPAAIDEWSHYLHGADNNAVAQDTKVRPPNSMQWKSAPMWCRSHEYNSSIAAMVSANGRMFYIMDQGLRGIIQIYDKNKRFPPRWSLVARGAFNGVELWQRPMKKWSPGAWGNFGFRSNPLVLPRRLVAVKDRLYVTLSYRGPVSEIDAATGKTLAVYKDTADTHEIIATGGMLILRTRDAGDTDAKKKWLDVREYIQAVDTSTGKTLWKHQTKHALVPLTLAAAKGRVCYNNYSEIVCLDQKTGKELWRAPSAERTKPRGPGGGEIFRKGNTGMLIIYRGSVLFSGKNGLAAFSLETGKKLWTGPKVRSVAPGNCFVSTGLFGVQGAVWPMIEEGALQVGDSRLRGSAVKFNGYDPKTGKIAKTVAVSHLLSRDHHVRCYPSKATERYLILPKRGAEFLDVVGDDHMRHDWLRGVCAYGVMPANGLTYAPSHQCFCYPGVVLKGFNALNAAAPPTKAQTANPLVRGPAYDKIAGGRPSPASVQDWPAYRHDRFRSGNSKTKIPDGVKPLWEVAIGKKLTQPIVAGGKLFVADKDAHTIHARNAQTGKAIWTFVADGRIDSPPTSYRDSLLFGCRDGWVYCLAAADGTLAWRFRAAPVERQIVGFEQLESAWPVHGSVLVQNDIVYFAAGRSSYLDGGIRVYGLDAARGKLLHQTVVSNKRPDVTKDPGRPFDMDGALADILVSDGEDLYMYQVRLNPDLTRHASPRSTTLGARPMGLHLMSTKGFVDDTWYDCTYWSYSKTWPGFYFSNLGPKSGQILSFDEDTTYGVKVFTKHEGQWFKGGHSPFFIPEQMGYELFADANSNEPILKAPNREKGSGYSRKDPARWKKDIQVRVMSMVLAGGKLFVAGPPNAVPAKDPYAAFEGRMGSTFCEYSTKDGKRLTEIKLKCTPIFDGMIAANGRIYLATVDGGIVCFGR